MLCSFPPPMSSSFPSAACWTFCSIRSFLMARLCDVIAPLTSLDWKSPALLRCRTKLRILEAFTRITAALLDARLLPFTAPAALSPFLVRCCDACGSTADPCTCTLAALSGAGGVGRPVGLLLTVAVGSKHATQSARYCSSHHGS